MTFYPINSHNTSLQSSRFNTFTDPYSIYDIIALPLERLRELEISGIGTIFPVAKYLLPQETDSSTKKIIKVVIAPFTMVTMGGVFVVDNLLKSFKDNYIEKLHKELERSNDSSKVLLDSESLGLQYFTSKDYENFEKDCDSNFDNIHNEHNQSKDTRCKLQNDFNNKLKKVRPALNSCLEKSSELLEKIEKILSESKNSNTSTIRNSIKKLKGNLYLQSNIDIVNDLEDIKDSLDRIAEQIDPKVKIALSQKSQRFHQKIDSYIEEYSKIESVIGSLKRKKACKESIESLEVEAGPVKIKTSKKPKEEESNYDHYMWELERKKRNLKKLIVETAHFYLNFFEETIDLLEMNYKPAIIEKNHEKLKQLLQSTKQNLDLYDSLFPKTEKETLENELIKVNSSTNINELIKKCRFDYNNELSNLKKLTTDNEKLIIEVENKVKELQSLSQHSPLKRDYQQKLIEKNESLKKINSDLTERYRKLDRFKTKIFSYRQKFMNLQLNRKKTLQESKYNNLYARFDRASRDLRANKPIDLQDICKELDKLYLKAKKPKLSFF